VIGAGGHARVCLEALLDDPSVEVVGCCSRDGAAIDGLGVAVLGTDEQFEELLRSTGASAGFVAIGDTPARQYWCARVRRAGVDLVNAISRTAIISRTAHLGSGVAVMPGAVINAATSLGDGVIVNTNATIDHDCRIGEGVHIAPAAAIAGGVIIGRGALIGIGAAVIPGIRIGAGAIVGAGAVVIRDVPGGVTVAGNPATAR
jgi:UDP-perosamine 4-acetyltransferase